MIGAFANRVAHELGYTISCDFADLGGDARFHFARQTAPGGTRALCFTLHRRPKRALFVDWVISQYAPSELAAKGLVRNARAESLFHFQTLRRDRAESEVLPQAVAVTDRRDDLVATLNRLESEIKDCDGAIESALDPPTRLDFKCEVQR